MRRSDRLRRIHRSAKVSNVISAMDKTMTFILHSGKAEFDKKSSECPYNERRLSAAV